MDFRMHNSSLKLFLTDKYGRIKPEQIGIYSLPGYGKSLCEEGLCESFFNRKFCCIILGDGMKGEEEGAHAMFEPTYKYHLELLRKEGKTPKKVPVKLYSPFTFNIPKTSLPNYNFYTIPIKSLLRSDFSMLAETQATSDTIKVLQQASKNLSKDGGIFQLLHDIQHLIKGKSKSKGITPTSKNFYLSVGSGTAKSMQEVSNLFHPFTTDYWLTKENSPYNLDFKKILDDNKSIHFFSTKYIKDPKMAEFVLLVLLNKIIENKNLTKNPICLIIPEIRKLCPDKVNVGFQRFLSEAVKNALSTIRSQGKGGIASILSSQSWIDTDQKVRDSHSMTLLGQLSISDIDKISKVLGYSRDRKQDLSNPEQPNTFLIVGREADDWYHMFVPSWAHAEPETRFEDLFQKHYPEKMKKPTEIINTMKKMFETEETKFREKAKKESEAEWLREKQKKKEKELREGQSYTELKKRESKLKEQVKLKDMERAYNMRQAKPNLSLVEIGSAFGVSKDTILRWIKKYGEILKEQVIETKSEETNPPINIEGASSEQ